MNILLVRPDGIGDEILSLPVATALRRLLPNARLIFLSSAYSAPLLAHHPDVDEVLTVHGGESFGELIRLFRGGIDTVLFLKPFRRLMAAAWLARVPLRVEAATVVLLLPEPTGLRAPERLFPSREFTTSASCAVLGFRQAKPPPRLVLAPQEREWARRFLGSRKLPEW